MAMNSSSNSRAAERSRSPNREKRSEAVPTERREGKATFSVPSGHLAGHYDAVYLSTDLESDDIVAIKALAPKLRGVPLFIVVGEGNVDGKCKMAAEMCAFYGIDEYATIVDGHRSEEKFPVGALSAFCGSTNSKATILQGDASKESEAFLRRYTAPLAIILKPPHELLGASAEVLGRTAAAAYGSFNFLRMRQDMPKFFGPLSADQAAQHQDAFISSFRRFYLIERWMNVGSYGVLNANQPFWKHIERDTGLMHVVHHWNLASVVRVSSRITQMVDELNRACEVPDGCTEASSNAEAFVEVAKIVKGAEPSLAILQEIANLHGMQVCLADPVVAAVLADEKGELVGPFERVGTVKNSSTTRAEFTAQKGASVAVLDAQGKTQELMQATLAVLTQMIA